MQYIDIFLASSIDDLHNERMELGNYIRVLNDMYQGRGIYFRLHMCEDISDELSTKRSQEIYNDVIRQCDYFYIMCWHKAGQYTLEEFDVALEQFKESGKAPKITTFFKQTDEPAEAVRKFMERLDGELQHYYTVFDSIDSVKLKILLEMAQRPELQMQVACQDAKLTLNGQEVKDIHMDKLPFYANHDKITELRKRLEQLNKDFIDVKLEIAADPQNDELFSKLYKLSGEKNKAEEELHKLEMDLMKLASRVVEMSTSGEYLTQRAKAAMQLFEQGKVKEALVILDDEERRRDAKRTAEKATEIKKEYQAYVKECQLKIDGLKTEGVTAESAEQIIALYEEIERYVQDGGLDRACLIDYMNFLRNQRDYQNALKKGRQIYHYFKSTDVYDITWAWFCNCFANVYSDTNYYEEAEKIYNEALEIYRKFARDNAQVYEYEAGVAGICNNLAILYEDTNRYEKAENLLTEALETQHRLARNSPKTYMPDMAMSCNNLAGLYSHTSRHEEAEKLYTEALEICRRLAKDNSQAYEPDVAMTCNNLAGLFINTNRYEEAEKLYSEALEIRRRLAKDNPQAYEPDVAKTCNNLAALYADTNRYEEAEKLYSEALEIRRRLAKDNPMAYEPSVADTCNGLARLLYIDLNRCEEAEKLYDEALEIRRKLAKTYPQVHESYVAITCVNLAALYDYKGRYKESEKLYTEALEIRCRLAKDNPQEYEPSLAYTCNRLAALYDYISRYEEAEELYNEALEIYRGLAKDNPQEYEPDVAMTLRDMWLFYKGRHKRSVARKLRIEALELAKKYKDTNGICRRIYEALTE